MEIFFALLASCAGNSPSPADSPHKGKWRRALMFSLICTWTNGWLKNGDTGYLKSLLAPKHTSQHGGCWWHCPSLHWRHNERYGISNHHRLGCLLSHLFGRRSKKTPKVRVIGFVWGIYRWPVNSLHKGPVTRKMFPCDDVAMSLAHGQLQPSGWSIRFAQIHFHRITCCWELRCHTAWFNSLGSRDAHMRP